MRKIKIWIGVFTCCAWGVSARSLQAEDLWTLAHRYSSIHRYSTLFTAQDVHRYLATEAGIEEAIRWCKQTGVTKVYLEAFRGGFWCPRAILLHAKKRFVQAGFQVCGCVTTTQVGKPSTGWKIISCYTDPATQDRLAEIFRYAAAMFDEIMIDDFWFTDCTCKACDAARRARQVRIGDRTWSVPASTWEAYRCELMVHLSEERILKPARAVNPKVKIIVKYPQWYDSFQDRGYEVGRETQLFDKIWVGTEIRDYTDPRWGGTVPYAAYFLMRWLGEIGGSKCGGGWFDWLGTTPPTYIEQARQTILGGARETVLFCYGGLHREHGPEDVAALRKNLPELFQVAAQVRKRRPIGVALYKPINSHPDGEKKVFDYVGMLGIPGVPTHWFPTNAPAAFFSKHAFKDPNFLPKLQRFVASGRPVLLTDGALQILQKKGIHFTGKNILVLPVKGNPKRLLSLPQKILDRLRAPLLDRLGIAFRAPNKVGLYWFQDGSFVVENFNNHQIHVRLQGCNITIPARGWVYEWK